METEKILENRENGITEIDTYEELTPDKRTAQRDIYDGSTNENGETREQRKEEEEEKMSESKLINKKYYDVNIGTYSGRLKKYKTYEDDLGIEHLILDLILFDLATGEMIEHSDFIKNDFIGSFMYKMKRFYNLEDGCSLHDILTSMHYGDFYVEVIKNNGYTNIKYRISTPSAEVKTEQEAKKIIEYTFD